MYKPKVGISKAGFIFYISVLCLCVMTSCSDQGDFADDEIKSFIDNYNQWSSPELYQRADYKPKFWRSVKHASGKLKKLLSSACDITFEFPNGETTSLTRKEFLDALDKTRATTLVEQFILDGPTFKNEQGLITVDMTKAFRSRGNVEVAQCNLLIDASGRKLLILEIRRTHRAVRKDEMQKLRTVVKNVPYNPKKGLGMRYLGGGNFNVARPCFSHDGRKIVFASLRHKSSEIYIMNVNGSGLRRLTNTKYWEVRPSFTPDGKSVMFLSDIDNYTGESYLVDMDGSNYRRLVPDYSGVTEAVYSPDGKHVAFTVQKGKAKEVYIMRANGTAIKKLTESGRENSSLVFSPDGRKIYFQQSWYDFSKKPPLYEEICSANIYDSGLEQLTDDRKMKTPIVVTAGRILFVRLNDDYDKELWWMRPDGTGQEPFLAGPSNGGYTSAKLLPGSDSIVFVDDREKTYRYHLYLKKLALTSKIRPLTKDYCSSEPSVSPNGRFIVYITPLREGQYPLGKGNIRIVDVKTGKIKTIGKNH